MADPAGELKDRLSQLDAVRSMIGEEAYLAARAKLLGRSGDIIPHDQNKAEIEKAEQSTVVVGSSNTINTYYQVYQQVEGQPGLDEEAFNQFLTNYLKWVSTYYDQARLFGLERLGVNENRPDRSLLDVFVPISLCRVMPPGSEDVDAILDGEDAGGLEKIKAYLRLVERRRGEAEAVVLTDLLTTGPRLAVIGGPGCGKSTLLNYLAVCLAQHITRGLPLPFNLPPEKPAPVPLIVPLRGYRAYQQLCRQSPQTSLSNPNIDTLSAYILYATNHYGGRISSFTRDGFERLLLGGGCLLMLDGLDEVVDRKERGRIRERVEELANGYPGNLVLLTARESGYQENAILSDRFVRLDVRSLDDVQIEQLVRNWCSQLYPAETDDRTAEITAAIQDINARRADTELPPLVTTPLMTTMIVGVKWSRTQLPRDRTKLYDAAVEVMLQLQYTRDDEDRDQLTEYGGTLDEQREWLWTLAYEMQRGGKAAAAITHERMVEILGDRLERAALERFANAVHERGGLFEEKAGLYQFAHLTFQEFLAGRCIVDRRLGKADLARFAVDPWWRETLLLAYGCAAWQAPTYARQYLEALSDLPGDARLAGLELAAAALLEIEKPNPDLREKQAARLAECLTDPHQTAPGQVRGRAGRTLAVLGDPRAGVLTVEQMSFCFVPSGPFLMGSEDGEKVEQPQHEVNLPDFWIGQYPVTNAQFDLFVEQGGYHAQRYWHEAQQHGYWKAEGFQGRYDNTPRTGPKSSGSPFNLPNHPVVNISWYEALAFSRWLSHKASTKGWLAAGFEILLPSEAEWEKAARGGLLIPNSPVILTLDGLKGPLNVSCIENSQPDRTYPWGTSSAAEFANVDETGIGSTSTVGSFPAGTSPYGCHDLSGNVWEWTRGLLVKDYPYDPNDREREDLQAGNDNLRVLRGGSWLTTLEGTRAVRIGTWNSPGHFYNHYGFRVVVRPSSTLNSDALNL